MKNTEKAWARWLAALAVAKPWWILCVVAVITAVMFGFSSKLEMRMNWTNMLPEKEPIVRSYLEVQERFGEQSIIIALEGERDDMVAMAEELTPRLKKLESLDNVQAELPLDFFRNHAFVNVKPDLFKRILDTYENPDLVGTFRGMNDDYEREYTESESNLKRDEVEIARSLLGLTRSLEILEANFTGQPQAPDIEEAVEAMTFGESYLLSLDRRMLLIGCTPKGNIVSDIDEVLTTVEEVEEQVRLVAPAHPNVKASLTGVAKIGLDEMESIGFYTQLLFLAALIFIYLLLMRTFRSWLIPIFALIPLVIGIFWTLGVLYLLFGGLNMFTAMMMLVLLGLGIDFSIHLISRFWEAITAGEDVETALAIMLGRTGTSVLTGALTTAFAFLTLMIAETRGVYEFGAAAGLGVLITLLAIFITLPALLAVQRRRFDKGLTRRGKEATVASELSADTGAYNWIGSVARAGWNRPVLFLSIAGILAVASIWAMQHTAFEYDFLKLEPKGLKSVALQREIPKRFGISDHSAWLIVNSIEESREMKEKLRKKGLVGEVASISDYIPSEARLTEYTPELEKFREHIKRQELPEWKPDDSQQLAAELDRLWDNLDLMSNLAFAAGLDRIIRVIDELTGYNMETNATDTTAILPSLTRTLYRGVDETRARTIAAVWGQRMKTNLYDMADPSQVYVSDLPAEIKRAHLPREGEGILLLIFPRKYLYDKKNLDRFTEQITSVSPAISGTEQLFVLMMDKTLEEGRRAAFLALGVIALLLMIHFRGLIGLLALIPLGTGSLAMLGLMYLVGMKYNFNNLIAVPIILGIGIDDGVHALHRFRTEVSAGTKRIFDSFRFVGRAILLTSLTTMIGFGSIALYEHRGMASFGQALFMGVGACFIATVFVLPAVLRIVYGKRKDIKV